MDLDFLLRAVQCAHVEYFDEPWGNFQMVRGSKTQDEIEQDVSFKRMKKILSKYRKKLPVTKRILSQINFQVLETGRFGLKVLRIFHINTKDLTNMIDH
jgi:hypothetical protein